MNLIQITLCCNTWYILSGQLNIAHATRNGIHQDIGGYYIATVDISEILIGLIKGCTQAVAIACAGFSADVYYFLRHYPPSYLIFMRANTLWILCFKR